MGLPYPSSTQLQSPNVELMRKKYKAKKPKFSRHCRKQMGNFSHEHKAPHRKNYGGMFAMYTSHALRGESPNIFGKRPQVSTAAITNYYHNHKQLQPQPQPITTTTTTNYHHHHHQQQQQQHHHHHQQQQQRQHQQQP